MAIIAGDSKRISPEGMDSFFGDINRSTFEYFGISQTSSGDGLGDEVSGPDIIGVPEDADYASLASELGNISSEYELD